MEDLEYISARNKYIPHAELRAVEAVGLRSNAVDKDRWDREWNHVFHDAMTRYWQEHVERMGTLAPTGVAP